MRSSDAEPARSSRATIFRREGAYWTIVYERRVIRLRDEKGLRYLECLLRHPGRSFHVGELTRMAASDTVRSVAAAEDPRAAERARKAVTNRIRQAVGRIHAAHATLGLHLRNSVHTGTSCSYTPERPIAWA